MPEWSSPYWDDLRRRLASRNRAHEATEAYQRAFVEWVGETNPPRAHELWTEQDDYLFQSGYVAWRSGRDE